MIEDDRSPKLLELHRKRRELGPEGLKEAAEHVGDCVECDEPLMYRDLWGVVTPGKRFMEVARCPECNEPECIVGEKQMEARCSYDLSGVYEYLFWAGEDREGKLLCGWCREDLEHGDAMMYHIEVPSGIVYHKGQLVHDPMWLLEESKGLKELVCGVIKGDVEHEKLETVMAIV